MSWLYALLIIAAWLVFVAVAMLVLHIISSALDRCLNGPIDNGFNDFSDVNGLFHDEGEYR